ncbi:hypothetical protein Vadar_024859 [Vaccinium darrowii]|nr:hypothetical protein Vadar_024859 [Vaccinium darrowii]
MEAATDPPRRRRRRQRKEVQSHTSTTTISELPSQIISDIISRLPLKSIFSCKRVCSSFRNQTLDPHFPQLQLPRSPLCLILYRPSNSARPTYFQFLPLDDSLVDLRSRRARIGFATQIDIAAVSRLNILNSCNGLICLANYLFTENVYVCNPVTRQHFRLPESKEKPSVMDEEPQPLFFWYGLGYSRSADLFKVVKFTLSLENVMSESFCSIYTLGVDDEWRNLGNAGLKLPLNLPHNRRFVFLNGALHWIGWENSMMLLYYFDMEKELCGNLPLPSQFDRHGFHLGVVDDCLYISDELTSSVSVNIWVMKDYGNIGSWTLEWIIKRPLPSGLGWDLKPIKTLEDGTVLMIVGRKPLLLIIRCQKS